MANLSHLPEWEAAAPPEGAERRHEPRIDCPARPTLRFAVRPDPRLCWGYAANISAGGVGFLAVEPVGPGAELELYVLEGPPSCLRVVRVTHCAPSGTGSWLVGCQVSPPFSGEEIACLL